MTLDDPIANVIDRLHRLGLEPRKAGEEYSCCCPAHKDRSPSLSIGIGSNGQALIKCHKGCSLDSILSRLHLEISDLFAEDGATKPRNSPPAKKRTFATSEGALVAYGLGHNSRCRPRRLSNSLAAAIRLVRVGRAVRYMRPSGDATGQPTDGIRLVVAT